MKYKFLWAEENYNYSELEPILLNYGLRSKKRWGFGINEGLTMGKDFHAEFYLPPKELKAEAENGFKFLTNEKKFNFLLNQIKINSKKVQVSMKKLISTNLSLLKNEELWEFYNHYTHTLGQLFSCYNVTQPHRVIKLEQELLGFLKRRKIKDITASLSLLTSSRKQFIFSSDKNKLFSQSFAELLGQENSVINKTLLYRKMYVEKAVKNKEKDKLLAVLKSNEKIKQLIDIFGILGNERFKMRFVWMLALYYNELFLIEFKRRYNATKSELRAYDQKEIEFLIRFGKKISSEVISVRKKGFLKVLKNGKIFTYQGEEAQQVLQELFSSTKKVEELKGTIASKGHSVGRVIVLSYRRSEEHNDKIKEMRKGDVIVTEMTRPNIIVACKKAGAIITDEGGLLCHAAIVARELKIPCIIGTKMATQVFKDGDLVEVDADKGLIKLIVKK